MRKNAGEGEDGATVGRGAGGGGVTVLGRSREEGGDGVRVPGSRGEGGEITSPTPMAPQFRTLSSPQSKTLLSPLR